MNRLYEPGEDRRRDQWLSDWKHKHQSEIVMMGMFAIPDCVHAAMAAEQDHVALRVVPLLQEAARLLREWNADKILSDRCDGCGVTFVNHTLEDDEHEDGCIALATEECLKSLEVWCPSRVQLIQGAIANLHELGIGEHDELGSDLEDKALTAVQELLDYCRYRDEEERRIAALDPDEDDDE